MSSKVIPSNDARVNGQRTANALDRLAALEDDFYNKVIPAIVERVNGSLGMTSQQLNAQGEVLEAVVSLLGEATVEARIKETREKLATATAEAEKAKFEEAKANGKLVTAESIGEKTIIVGREEDANGVERVPGRFQIPFDRVNPTIKEKLLGQKAGFKLSLDGGGVFEVLELAEEVAQPADAKAGE